MLKRFFFIIFVIGISMTLFAAGEKVWVSSSGATLKADKSASSKNVASLPIGMQLSVISSDGSWYQVSTQSGQKGWIYRGKISNNPPSNADSKKGQGNVLGGLLSSNIKSQYASDTSRSIRGLSPEAKEYAMKNGTPKDCQNALDEVLKLKVNPSEIETFLKTGKVGEYAE
ncbi:MAG: SH3 domain-containing protein [Desulfobacterales bacterium]|nr:SH3 domain-containing protein [Desulfobacterales bacterium]MBF0397470.1 SH3 domain-containing protein [Desulfobacterales bacterium]